MPRMKSAVLLAAVLVAALGALAWSLRERNHGPDAARATAGEVGGRERAAAAASDAAGSPDPHGAQRADERVRDTATAQDVPATARDQAATSGQPPAPSWPVATARAAGKAPAGAAANASPDVAIELAFKALNFVGVDPEAEKIWLRAIRDPKTPDGVRSDLIEDLNDEGYVDNSHPGKEDLDLILARMRLIERLQPLETDPVNAAAFEEAYKDLLAMYVRLGGKPAK